MRDRGELESKISVEKEILWSHIYLLNDCITVTTPKSHFRVECNLLTACPRYECFRSLSVGLWHRWAQVFSNCSCAYNELYLDVVAADATALCYYQ